MKKTARFAAVGGIELAAAAGGNAVVVYDWLSGGVLRVTGTYATGGGAVSWAGR